METEEEIVNINFGEVGMNLPRSIEAIQTARKLLDMLEENIRGEVNKNHTCKSQGCPQNETKHPQTIALQENRVESPAERKDEVIASIPQGTTSPQFETIAKFEYDKSKEKSYKNLFFFEHSDGRVMLSYSNGRLYTTQAAVMQIPFPVPCGYEPLKELSTNNKVAVRTYRKYLAEPEQKGMGIDKASDKASETERKEKLKRTAEVNAQRWQTPKPQKEMSQRTKELRDGIVAKMVLGVGAEKGN